MASFSPWSRQPSGEQADPGPASFQTHSDSVKLFAGDEGRQPGPALLGGNQRQEALREGIRCWVNKSYQWCFSSQWTRSSIKDADWP